MCLFKDYYLTIMVFFFDKKVIRLFKIDFHDVNYKNTFMLKIELTVVNSSN